MSFRREKYVPRGGPDGGDGGRGGDVVIVASRNINTLYDASRLPAYRAERGKNGEGGRRTGRSGGSIEVSVPIGTIIHDQDGIFLADLVSDEERFVAAQGGKGGRGNARFATATCQAPRDWERGQPGEKQTLSCELKLIADVGIVGLPNAGKSTFLSTVSAAKPRIANYPFTTLTPQLGMVQVDEDRRLVLADIPGLIEGAHEGSGLGDQFLRHIERTRVLLHLVDVSPFSHARPSEAYSTLRKELQLYSQTLASKPEIVVASKADSPDIEATLAELESVSNQSPIALSSHTRRGIPQIFSRLIALLDQEPTDTD
jgi:GTP-binding protein